MRFQQCILSAAAGVAFCLPAAAQAVVISEINTSATPQWIELHNPGSSDTEISTWSLFVATKTANQPQNYWFPFPANTTIKAGEYLTVFWGAAIPNTTPANQLFTGNSKFNFLFGFGFERMATASGAVGLFNSKRNTDMNKATVVEDWISWGSAGQRRENLAVANKRWVKDAFVASPTKGSIALGVRLNQLETPVSALFNDETPTQGRANSADEAIVPFGTPCQRFNANRVTLETEGIITDGNKDTFLVLNNTRGPVFREVYFILVTTNATNGVGFNFLDCPVNTRGTLIALLGPTATALGRTRLRIPLNTPNAAGTRLDLAAVFAAANGGDTGSTNGLDITVGK